MTNLYLPNAETVIFNGKAKDETIRMATLVFSDLTEDAHLKALYAVFTPFVANAMIYDNLVESEIDESHKYTARYCADDCTVLVMLETMTESKYSTTGIVILDFECEPESWAKFQNDLHLRQFCQNVVADKYDFIRLER